MAIRIDTFSRNSKILSPGAPYWSKLSGWNSHDKVGTGVPAAAAAAAMAFARSLRFSSAYCQTWLRPQFCGCCRLNAVRNLSLLQSAIMKSLITHIFRVFQLWTTGRCRTHLQGQVQYKVGGTSCAAILEYMRGSASALPFIMRSYGGLATEGTVSGLRSRFVRNPLP
jgi:hypothetical protein